MKLIIGIAAALAITLITGRVAASPCSDQQNDLQMINDLNNDFAQGRMPMIPTGVGGGSVLDLGGQITDFTVIADNGGLLDCTLRLVRPQASLYEPHWETVRMRYWRNVAGQLLHQVTALQLGQQRITTKVPNAGGGCDHGWHREPWPSQLCVPN